ncbi:MAG: MaoC family dehydratase [Candidatus Hodarchaeales archaeon]|jgi:3-hydroxybutyryl-CoA dehydratase
MKYSEIQVGYGAESKHTITEEDIVKFAEVSGDFNPVHMNEEFAQTTIFKGRIAHGMLSVSYISATLAKQIPGTIYLKQTVMFKKPVRIGDTISTKVEVISKNDEKKRITLTTTCSNQREEEVVTGEALVMLFE